MHVPTTLDYLLGHLRELPVTLARRERSAALFPRSLSQFRLTWRRSLAVLAGLCIAYVGFKEAQLRVACGSRVELGARELAESAEQGPLWVKVRGLAPPVDVAISASESGNRKSAWLPLLSEDSPELVRAVICVEDMGDAWSLQSRQGPITIEGLAYLPRSGDAGNISSYVSRLKLEESHGLRMIEAGRTPSSLVGSLLCCAAGILIVRHAFRWTPAPIAKGPPVLHSIPSHESEPLTEDVRVELRHMLDEVWAETRQG